MRLSLPVVALESTVITHGLPYPQNLSLAHDMEAAVRDEGATPATIAVMEGQVHVGLSEHQLEELSRNKQALKVSRRDLAAAMLHKADGGTTVAGTLYIAHQAGIRLFATGGIGGVHHEARFDVSADLPALSDTPMIVVCAGAKAILDLPATLEYLETMSVPVVGYQTDEFPAFYSRESGLKVSVRLETPEEIVDFARIHWGTGMHSAVLVTQPIPKGAEIPKHDMDPIIERASRDATAGGVRGQKLTPFLLQRINELTSSKSLHANLSLLLNNAHLAAQIARALSSSQRTRMI
jgi:pseudouridine-5'-phosphate glycosidase